MDDIILGLLNKSDSSYIPPEMDVAGVVVSTREHIDLPESDNDRLDAKHAYLLDDVYVQNGVTMVRLFNPHGGDETSAYKVIPYTKLFDNISAVSYLFDKP